MGTEPTRRLGVVSLVQLQPEGLLIETPGKTPSGYFYDAGRRVEVDRLQITPRGIEATLPGGERALDIHHLDHPDKAYEDDDLVSIGFTAHYDAMRREFGEHIVDGIAGENIIIEAPDEIWPDDLGARVGIEDQDTGRVAELVVVEFASPCVEFGQFCAQRQYEEIVTSRMREILQFLGRGRRGFLLVLDEGHDVVTVRPGDEVLSLGGHG
jgi:hypothetical protein